MATSIYPDPASAGGVVYRLANGTCLNPVTDIFNAFCPPVAYKSSCDLTALPSNCDARVEPRQINAIVSEILSLAACLDPTGTWNCNSLQNLCTAFTAWVAANISSQAIITAADTPPSSPKDSSLWWESDTGILFIRYNDGSSVQWVQINTYDVIDNVSIVGASTLASPLMVGIVDCGSY